MASWRERSSTAICTLCRPLISAISCTAPGSSSQQPSTTRTPPNSAVHVADRAGAARQTLCFEGHNLTIVAADGYLTKPLVVSCLDINLGQRCAAAASHHAVREVERERRVACTEF